MHGKKKSGFPGKEQACESFQNFFDDCDSMGSRNRCYQIYTFLAQDKASKG